MRINEIVRVNVTEKGLLIEQGVTDDYLLMCLLIEKRDSLRSEDNNELASKVQELIRELY